MKSVFKIFFDCHSLDSGWQGTTTYLAGILNSLPRVAARLEPEIDLRIICSAQNQDRIRRHVDINFEFVKVRSGFGRRNLFDIPRALRACGADLVVSQYVRPFVSPCPTVSVIHDVLFLDYPNSFGWGYRNTRRLMFGWAARHSDIVATVSRYSAQRIAAHFGIEESSIAVMPNAVDPAFLAARPVRGEGRFRLLSVSRLERRKRHEWGIAAVEALAADGIDSEYVVVGGGTGAYADELRGQIAAAQSAGYMVDLKSNLGFDALVAEYAAADIFVFPTEAEGFGIPLIEAAAAGKPCVVSTGGALAEFNGQFSGVAFPPDDMTAFIAGVKKVAANLQYYRSEAEQKRRAVGDSYNWDVVAESYVDFIRLIRGAKA